MILLHWAQIQEVPLLDHQLDEELLNWVFCLLYSFPFFLRGGDECLLSWEAGVASPCGGMELPPPGDPRTPPSTAEIPAESSPSISEFVNFYKN